MNIKFRARNSKNDLFYFSVFDLQGEDHADPDYFYIKQTGYRLIKRTLERWTGLVDKNNVDIYEGDIVKAPYILGGKLWHRKKEVVFIDGAYGFRGDVFDALYSLDTNSLEVINNTTDNKDLLG